VRDFRDHPAFPSDDERWCSVCACLHTGTIDDWCPVSGLWPDDRDPEAEPSRADRLWWAVNSPSQN
jgi:hypothetical protein